MQDLWKWLRLGWSLFVRGFKTLLPLDEPPTPQRRRQTATQRRTTKQSKRATSTKTKTANTKKKTTKGKATKKTRNIKSG